MAEPGNGSGRPTDPVGRLLYSIARWLAILGGAILAAMALLTTVSIAGRAAFSAPVRGDFELVAIGTGIAVFAFLPWCQLTRGNVLVDFFMDRAPVRAKAACGRPGRHPLRAARRAAHLAHGVWRDRHAPVRRALAHAELSALDDLPGFRWS